MPGPESNEKPYEKAVAAILNDSFDTIEPAELIQQLNLLDSDGRTGWLDVILAIARDIKRCCIRLEKLFDYLNRKEDASTQIFNALCQKDASGQTGWKTIIRNAPYGYSTLLSYIENVANAPTWLLNNLCERDESGKTEWELALNKGYFTLPTCLGYVKDVPGAYEKLCQAFCAKGRTPGIEEQQKVWEMIIWNDIQALPNFINQLSNQRSKDQLAICALTKNKNPRKAFDSLELIKTDYIARPVVLPITAKFVYEKLLFGSLTDEQKTMANDDRVRTAVVEHVLQLPEEEKIKVLKDIFTSSSYLSKYLNENDSLIQQFERYKPTIKVYQFLNSFVMESEQGKLLPELDTKNLSLGERSLLKAALERNFERNLHGLVELISKAPQLSRTVLELISDMEGVGVYLFPSRKAVYGLTNLERIYIEIKDLKMIFETIMEHAPHALLEIFELTKKVNGATRTLLGFLNEHDEKYVKIYWKKLIRQAIDILPDILKLIPAYDKDFADYILGEWVPLFARGKSDFDLVMEHPVASEAALPIISKFIYERLLDYELSVSVKTNANNKRVKEAVVEYILNLPESKRNSAIIEACTKYTRLNKYIKNAKNFSLLTQPQPFKAVEDAIALQEKSAAAPSSSVALIIQKNY